MGIKKSSEAGFQRAVIQMANLYGWKVAHFRTALTASGHYVTPVQADGKGFPDLVLVHKKRGRIIFVELKTDKGKLTKEQAEWIEALSACTEDAWVWRPELWSVIEEILS